MKRFLYLICLLSTFSVVSAEITLSHTIDAVRYNGSSGALYFQNNTGWGAPGCPNARYVFMRITTSGQKEVMSIGLAAKVTNKIVQFEGDCTSSSYFLANYIHF